MKVLVTGGSGFVGKNLKKEKPDWIYVSSSNYDLMSFDSAVKMIQDIKPDAIVHLASIVGGVSANMNNQVGFLEKNIILNNNVVMAARLNNIKRLLASLSTCVFPDQLKDYPFDESSIFNGKPPDSNLGYAISKRTLYVHCNSCRKDFGLNYSTFSPSNIYGPHDHFESEDSHFVPSLVRRLHSAKNNDILEMWGTGKPLRQQLYVKDLVKIIPILLEKHNTNIPVIVSPNENLSIEKMCNIASKSILKNVNFTFNGKYEGQYRKDGSNKYLLNLIGDYEFTKFKTGFKETYFSYLTPRIE